MLSLLATPEIGRRIPAGRPFDVVCEFVGALAVRDAHQVRSYFRLAEDLELHYGAQVALAEAVFRRYGVMPQLADIADWSNVQSVVDWVYRNAARERLL